MKTNHEDDFNDMFISDIDFKIDIINKYVSIEEYKKSDEWKGMKEIYETITLFRQIN